MGIKKKDNTAIKEIEDFASEVLVEELKTSLESVSDHNAEDFFESLKNEVLEEGIVLEPSQITNISLVKEVPEAVLDEVDEAKTKVQNMDENATRVQDLVHEETLVQDEVEEHSHASFAEPDSPEEYNTNPVRQFEDKTAAVREDYSTSLSDLDQVASVEVESAAALHQNMKRNPSIDLKNADYISFAQDKIKSLEKEAAGLREETQELALAGSHFKALADEREQRNRTLEAKVSELQSTSVEEKKILNDALAAKETKIGLLQERVESLELELESKYNRLRVRERELESRLEILKQEQDAVFSSKDDMILRVKKQNNALTSDLERARSQTQKASEQLQEKEDALRRTIKALKLSLTMLESQKHN